MPIIRVYEAQQWLQKVKALGYHSFYFDELRKHNLAHRGMLFRCIRHEDIVPIPEEKSYRNSHWVTKWKIKE